MKGGDVMVHHMWHTLSSKCSSKKGRHNLLKKRFTLTLITGRLQSEWNFPSLERDTQPHSVLNAPRSMRRITRACKNKPAAKMAAHTSIIGDY